jgi:hypothetical protein
MIGIIADPAEQEIVREFFELFKTPWEFFRQGRRYDVLLCADDGTFDTTAKLVLVYSGRKTHFDDEQKIQVRGQRKQACMLSYQGNGLPLYGETITFAEKGTCFLTDEVLKECGAILYASEDKVLARIGYDLFREVRRLLTVGQPAANSALPALELHIALLRDLITGAGVPLVEIPARPDGFQFIACLTHDVDHPSIRRHKWDHTVFGFLYRAVVGSFVKLILGQMPIENLLANWVAALKLPFVYMGLAKDFWSDFHDRYLELEGDLPSTFFVIPFKDQAGRRADRPAPPFRASRYGAGDIQDTIRKLMAGGREVGLHGIDSWLASANGSKELEEIRRLTGASEIGVRMHWLYFDERSPGVLETAGAAYDSTIGYNETVGYRSGTTQAFKPVGLRRMLELPMHVMDTALFYPDHLALSPRQAKTTLGRMVDNAIHYGGVLTINWHDRSLAPERLWGASYREVVQDMKSRGAWFSTARQAIAWFEKRRSAVFESDSAKPGSTRAKVPCNSGERIPGLRLRTYNAGNPVGMDARRSANYLDSAIMESVERDVPSGTRS